jgi:hypothetical protein
MTEDLDDWMDAEIIVALAMVDIGMDKPKEELIDADKKRILHYVGQWANEYDFVHPYSPRLGLFAVGIMLTVCLLEFPEYYQKYELAQFN